MLFPLGHSKPVSRRHAWRRPRAVLATVALGTAALGRVQPSPVDPGKDWNYPYTPGDLPTLDWAATPPDPRQRFQGQTLDLSYFEVASLMQKRMSGRDNPEKISATAAQIIRLCHLLDFQPSFILALIEHESSFKPQVTSPAGAIGLMQLLPATARIVGQDLGISVPAGGANLKDPVVNVTLGMHYLAQLHDDFKTLASTLAAYNLGPARWLKYLSQPGNKRPQSVAKYVALIQRTTERIQAEARHGGPGRVLAQLPASRQPGLRSL